MGSDKALVLQGGKPLLTWAIEALLSRLPRVIVVTGRADAYRTLTRDLPVTFAADHFPDAGPLAGLHAGLCELHARESGAVFAACDMPFISGQAVGFLMERLGRETAPIVAFEELSGRRQHLPAAISKASCTRVEETLRRGENCSLGAFYAREGARYVPILNVAPEHEARLLLRNLNTPEDLDDAGPIA